METTVISSQPIIYPSSDGKPIADNTKQFDLITLIKENLACHFSNDPSVFVAGDLLWYPVEGNTKICRAPDVMIAFGSKKRDRKSYIQHQENGIAPQVVFEIISDSNRQHPIEMLRKFSFYQRFGVEEYYVYDPDLIELEVFIRKGDYFLELDPMIFPFKSPLLQITFDIIEEQLSIMYPGGELFKRVGDLKSELNETKLVLNEAKSALDNEREKAEKLADKLREMGINREQI
ncbi:MAG: Uma2 family endonuclease [Verrucomicrobia bacterium]|nr:Uma2 family endonuclease [Cytophagales bacterium]